MRTVIGWEECDDGWEECGVEFIGDNMDDDDATQSRKRRHPSQDDEPSGETRRD